jgi:hypothetical protein
LIEEEDASQLLDLLGAVGHVDLDIFRVAPMAPRTLGETVQV